MKFVNEWLEWFRKTLLVCGVLFLFFFTLTQFGVGYLPILPSIVTKGTR